MKERKREREKERARGREEDREKERKKERQSLLDLFPLFFSLPSTIFFSGNKLVSGKRKTKKGESEEKERGKQKR